MVKFEAQWTNVRDEIISMSQAWDKQKIWIPDMIRTYDLPYTRWALYPLSYGETMESEAIY